MKRVELTIHGRVQGVFYRASAQDKARILGLTGWVRNEPDGTVTATAEGDKEKLKEFVEWCKEGSPPAEVTQVEEKWKRKASGQFDDFEIRY